MQRSAGRTHAEHIDPTFAAAGWGVDQGKLTPLLRLRYNNSIADALNDLGKAEDIGTTFSGFQKYLYQGGPHAEAL